MKIKIIFIDIDGTIRSDKKNISFKTKRIIKKIIKKGILVVICSGRNREFTKNISIKCHASSYIISSNGAEIYDYQNNKIIYEENIDVITCQNLFDIANKYDVTINFNVCNKQYTNKKINNNNKIFFSNFNTILNKNNIVQCIILDNDYYKMIKVKKELLKLKKIKIVNCSKHFLDKNIDVFDYSYFDLVKNNVSKGNAIIKLCKILNINLKKTMAIGDSYNDISMFNHVAYSVAMGNSLDDVKQYAKIITDTNNKNGVYKILKDVLNNKI